MTKTAMSETLMKLLTSPGTTTTGGNLPRRHRLHMHLKSLALAPLALVGFVDATPARADCDNRIPEIGYVASATASADRLQAFRQGLVANGYTEGTNLILDFSLLHAGGADAEYIGPAAEMLALGEDLIVAGNAPAAVAISEATCKIPIVLAAVNDPVTLGLVQSLDHPGTNVTGTTIQAPQLFSTRLQRFPRMGPGGTKVSMFTNGGDATNGPEYELSVQEARTPRGE